MAEEQGFSLDMTDFVAGYNALRDSMVHNAREGLFYAAAELLRDSNQVEPKTPKLSGDLKGSWKVEAVEKSPDDWFLECGFNIEYAAYVHEMVKGNVNWSEPGSGPKFLESKLTMFGKKYLKIALSFVQDTGGAGAG